MKTCLLVLFTLTLTATLRAQSVQNDKTMNNFIADSTAIAKVVENVYFKGIYEGDIDLLKTIYYENTLLFGDIKGQPYFKTLEQYLDGVKNRQSVKDSGKPFSGEIIGIDVVNSIAVVKLRVKMYDFNYFELLSFHRFDNKWLIVTKMLTDVQQ